MPIGPGGLDSNGIWQFGEDDSEALASDLLNLGMGSVSTAISTLGGVLQVVSTTKTNAFTTTSTSMVDVTGLTVTITPASASNKILVMANFVTSNSSTAGNLFNLVRESTAIGVGTGATNNATVIHYEGVSAPSAISPINTSFLDSPSSISATTYKLQMAVAGHTGFVGRRATDTLWASSSTITVMEVSG